MITRDEFFKAFQDTMTGKLSSKEFARQAVAFYKSPDYNRWKAMTAAEDLKIWREGRDRLFQLIEEARNEGVNVAYETLPLKGGHDTIKVTIGDGTICFPSFFPKESVEMNWNDLVERRKAVRACGKADCATSTSIDDVTLTFGRGTLDDYGYWEFPCKVCAEAYKKDHPKASVWPMKDAAQ